MKPGESRVVRELPCPQRQMVHANEYWLLRRAGNRLMETFNFWDLSAWRNYQDAMVILKTLADGMPTNPSKAWTLHKLGIVREICCPVCEQLFEWEGEFYAPQCPHCKRFLDSHEQTTCVGQAPIPSGQSSETRSVENDEQ